MIETFEQSFNKQINQFSKHFDETKKLIMEKIVSKEIHAYIYILVCFFIYFI